MCDNTITKTVSEFYDDLVGKCNFKTRVNTHDLPDRIIDLIKQLSEETMKRYYGSGIIIPENIKGARVLDIGCGSGSLVFILSKLVGPSGHVVGIDVSPGQIAIAKQESDRHTKQWGFDTPNFEFILAEAGQLPDMGLEPFDVVVSNGVFCLIPDKQKAFQAVAAVLKPGGQFYINDVYAEIEQPEEVKKDKIFWSLCTSGAAVWSTLKEVTAREGFTTPYLTQVAGVDIKNEEFRRLTNNAQYVCAAWRLFKLDPAVRRGPATVTYLGNIEDYPETFPWDVDLTFVKGYPVTVDGELATILEYSYFRDNFDLQDTQETVQTKRNQDPFKLLNEQAERGQAPEPIYCLR